MSRTTTIVIRWLLPVCWFRGHDWQTVEAATAFEWDGQSCRRCEVFQPCLCDAWELRKPDSTNYQPAVCKIHPERVA